VSRKTLFDLLWLSTLGVFIFVGMPIASFHGDETYHIYTSRDYATAFIEHRPQDLMVHSLWETDQGYQRLMNGELTRYIIGVGWQLAGLTPKQLPDHGYLFGENYDDNVGRGLVPPPDYLNIFRAPVALCFVLSAGVMFLIGKLYGGRPLAYFVSGLYVINPIMLLNGRRALQESPLLLFGLLTIYIALVIAWKRETELPVTARWGWGLIAAGTLTFAAKQSGFVYVIPAYLAIFLPEVLRSVRRFGLRLGRGIFVLMRKLLLCTLLTLLFYFVITPGLWYDPLARVQDMINGRLDAIRVQVDIDPNAPTTLEERAADIISEPFMMPLQHYELAPVRDSLAQDEQIAAYMVSPLSGLQFGPILGGLLTLLAFYGLVVNAVPSVRPNRSWALAIGLYLWLAVNVVVLMDTPLPWQRYYLSLIPVMTLLCGVTLVSLIHVYGRVAGRRIYYA